MGVHRVRNRKLLLHSLSVLNESLNFYAVVFVTLAIVGRLY